MKAEIFEYIEGWYNTRRIQKRLGYLSPREYLKKKYKETKTDKKNVSNLLK